MSMLILEKFASCRFVWKQQTACIFIPKDGDTTFLEDVRIYSPHFTRKSLRRGGGGVGSGAVRGGKCTGGWTKRLLLVENSMTHQGVTLLHTD
jgi:hypothetical protein